MYTMVIEGIDEQLMQSLQLRATNTNITPEQEVLRVLNYFAREPEFVDFYDALTRFPNVGLDSDFERVN
ncbi:hypothetical protein PAN31117_03448 [Pandoraea anapnoica]|uniref:Uncharacterized protein n=1 Tax=Pandoraea anapnoica TaxID=2508301 RepID=A0A5E5A7T9_9BURK|nr:hypothetical protein [Pandoraea anapnoica]VVE69751.1 hypothetical protein PAN31117_03448 [Pandoraea anapnoica]